MATAETAKLIATLELQDKNFTRGIAQVEKGVGRVDKKLSAFGGFVNRNMARAIDSIGVRIVSSVGVGLEEMATLEDAASSVTGAIGQVGEGWTITADDVVAAANRIESSTDAAFDDKLIVGATETLIRYGKVSEKNLVPAMEVMTDLAARTGDVDSAATLLAKALADPAKAAGKLARAGVVLTKEQQKQLKAMVEVGDTAGAQTFLLEELAKTTKGAAAASAGPYRDALNKLGDAGEDLRRAFVIGLAPALMEVSDLLTTELAKPSTIQALKDVGKELGSALKGIIGIAKSLPWDTIGASLKLAGTGAKAVLDAFLGLPPWVQTAVLTGWGLNKLTGGALSGIVGTLASGLIKGVLGMNAGVVNINAGVVNGAPGIPGAKGGPGLLGTAARVIVPVTIAGVTIGAAKVLTDAIDPGFQEGLDRGDTPLANRDPRRFDKEGRVTNQWLSQVAGNTAATAQNTAKPPPGSSGGRGGAPGAFRPTQEMKEQAVKVQAVANAVKNAQSIASRENSAQKTEIGNVKNAVATMDQNQKATLLAQTAVNVIGNIQQQAAAVAAAIDAAAQANATRTAGTTAAAASRGAGNQTAGAMSSAASRIVTAIWAARPFIQSTNVVNNYTRTQRTGATSGSRNGTSYSGYR